MTETAQKKSPLIVRAYNPNTDYDIVRKWWMKRDNVFVRKEWLPNTGVVVDRAGEPICMTWMYITNSKMAQAGWTTTKPGLGARDSHKAVTMALLKIKKMASNLGVTYLQYTSNKRGLTKVLKRLGFEGSDNYTFLVLKGG